MCRGRIQWWQSITFSAAPVAGWTLLAAEESTAFFTMEPLWLSHFRSWEMVLPWNLNDSTAVTVLFMVVSGGGGGPPEVHDHLHSFEHVKFQVVKTAPDSQLINLLSVSRLVIILDEADQCGVICKLQELDGGSLDLQSLVYREKSSGERTQPWGAPVLIVRVLDENFASLAAACLSGSYWSTDRQFLFIILLF